MLARRLDMTFDGRAPRDGVGGPDMMRGFNANTAEFASFWSSRRGFVPCSLSRHSPIGYSQGKNRVRDDW